MIKSEEAWYVCHRDVTFLSNKLTILHCLASEYGGDTLAVEVLIKTGFLELESSICFKCNKY